MSILIIIFAVLLKTVCGIPSPADYVQKYCADSPCQEKKTICQRNGYCASESDCTIIPSTDDFRKYVLHYHNALRNRIALGHERRNGNTQASRMNALSYDKEIEFLTWCHSSRCEFRYDECRGTTKYPRIGQNMAMHNGSLTNNIDFGQLRHWMDFWYEELLLTDSDGGTFDELPNDLNDFAHVTQLLWESAQFVGCTRSYSNSSNGTFNIYFFCQYDTGNVPGERVYRRGPPCSKCPGGKKCNRKYMGLCGESRMDYGPNKYYLYAADKPKPVYVVEDGEINYKTIREIEYYNPLTFGKAVRITFRFFDCLLVFLIHLGIFLLIK